MNTTRVLGTLAALCTGAGLSAAAPQPAALPAYQFLRSQEDWSVLAHPSAAAQDPYNALKYVPLGGDGAWASFGADARLRVEGWDGFNFGAPLTAVHDDTFTLFRARAHADLHVDPALRIFAEAKTALAWSRDLPGGIRTVDQDKGELQQLFVDIRVPLASGGSLVLRPGRQEFGFGVQRLVSALPWANSLRTWDGASAILNTGGWNITAFEAAFVPVVPNGIGRSDRHELLGGVYGRHLIAGPSDGIEVYALRNDWDHPHAFNGTVGADRRWTLGFRRWGGFARAFDYDVEADYQLGSTGAGDVSAWSFGSQVGYRVPADKRLRLWVGFDWASGDRKAGGDVQTFNQLYPLGHAYFGAIDMIGRQNILDYSAGATWKPVARLTLGFGQHWFQADSTHDAIYNAGGAVVRAGGTYHSRDIGTESDFTVGWQADRHWLLEVGYGHFFAGDAIRQSGPHDDIDFWYASTSFTF